MAESTTTQPVMSRMLGVFAALSVAGMVGLAATATIGFEEPNSFLLVASCLLMLAAPAALLVHLIVTKELTPDDKRIWLRALASPRAPWVFSAYLDGGDRHAAAVRLAEEASARGRRP